MPVLSLSELPGLVGLFLNATIALLIQWFYSGMSTKSLADVQHLIDDVIMHEDFRAEDLHGINFAQEVKKLDAFESSFEGKGWKESSVKIRVPCPGYECDETEAQEFEVPGVLHRDLVDIIKITCQDPDTFNSFHIVPFKEMWKPSESAEPIRLYREAYTSDEMVNVYEEVQNIPPDPSSPNIENVVIEILVYSDATQLAQFSTASAHPVYSFFGNLSKYICCQPGSHVAHHTAYFPQLPDLFTDWYRETFGQDPSDETITHCKRELIHVVWTLILNAAFMMAYEFGILVCFADKIVCRVFPHLFAYMADYPEK
ncbi:hypothetical protein BDM02DRAFT_3192107 [Thelephora ganbajun]|uniref:Uncharacterized protein n=1 Tax=Thelephora ganbajun TaxID=370292 RepID=A0ACB6Z0Q6_THEGA|nr:hypothetical protein BDM02DRAFT_3192107 [Thelephora ganbajun]